MSETALLEDPLTAQTKLCRGCGLTKPTSEFTPDLKRRDGLKYRCRKCFADHQKRYDHSHPNKKRSRVHKIDFDSLWLLQQGLCALCGGLMLPKGRSRSSVTVDHDHRCCPGKTSCGRCVRGLVHARCNAFLGYVDTQPALLQQVVSYLARWERRQG